MTLDDAIQVACADVGIIPPKNPIAGRWAKADTLSGKNGRGDGRLMIDDARVTAHNWQTGISKTVWLDDAIEPKERSRISRQVARERDSQQGNAKRAAMVSEKLIAAAELSTHPYLASKGFQAERAMVVRTAAIQHIAAGLVSIPDGSERVLLVPARKAGKVVSCQLIFEDASKRFLFGGTTGGAYHRVARGNDHWLCEGFATGLTLRAALKGLKRSDTVLCCFSASNVLAVSRSIKGRCFIVTDNDKPIEHFDGLGTGEHYARQSGKPYVMPPQLGDDLNDMHMKVGIFAVQKLLATFIRKGGASS